MRWQIASRVLRQPVVLPFVEDTRLIISKNMPGAAVNYYFGLPEVEEVGLALHALRENDLFGDIGANIGALSIAAAAVAKARVVAMEPVPSTFAALTDNIAINRLNGRIQAHPAGAGAERGSLKFSTDRGGNDRIVTTGPGQVIDVLPLDKVFTETPFMLVVDVEGLEPAVVAGASRLLADPALKIVILETLGLASDYDLDDKAMHAKMLAYGFATYKYDPFSRNIARTEMMDSYNTIYIRDVESVKQRLRTASSFKVDGRAI